MRFRKLSSLARCPKHGEEEDTAFEEHCAYSNQVEQRSRVHLRNRSQVRMRCSGLGLVQRAGPFELAAMVPSHAHVCRLLQWCILAAMGLD